MNTPSPGKPRLNRAIVTIALLVAACLAGLTLLEEQFSSSELFTAAPQTLLAALMLQILASVLFVLAWRTLFVGRSPAFGFAACAAQVGVTLLGKYLPGKVWGLVGRSYLLTRGGTSASVALGLLLADQMITFATGFTIGLLALLAFFQPTLAGVLLLVIVLSVPVLLILQSHIIAVALRAVAWILRRIPRLESEPQVVLSGGQLSLATGSYVLHWLVTCSVLFVIYQPLFGPESASGLLLLVAAIPLGMLLGFLALWAPGGIGVREAVIIAVMALQFPLEVGTAIALGYRLICIGIDLALGGFAIAYFGRATLNQIQPGA